MAVRIRLKRLGRKKRPFYRIVIADSRAPRDGRSIENIGIYNPISTPMELIFDEDRLFHWLSEGAQPSDTVKSLMNKQALVMKYDMRARGADQSTIDREIQKWELATAEREKREGAKPVDAKVEAEPEANVETPAVEAEGA